MFTRTSLFMPSWLVGCNGPGNWKEVCIVLSLTVKTTSDEGKTTLLLYSLHFGLFLCENSNKTANQFAQPFEYGFYTLVPVGVNWNGVDPQ